jgi:hypothetical protein
MTALKPVQSYILALNTGRGHNLLISAAQERNILWALKWFNPMKKNRKEPDN